MPENIGLYIHIPFCSKKCHYCDFYSVCFNERVYNAYVGALIREIKSWGIRIKRKIDTVYFGGGTPSLLRFDIVPIMSAIRESFDVAADAEITAECNPNCDLSFLEAAKKAGVNRLSFGVQAGSDDRLKTLGRTHTVNDAVNSVEEARKRGFDNISLDIMIALPKSNNKTLCEDVDFICRLTPQHISAYMLKIEENTAFFHLKDKLNMPDEDETARQYLDVCENLKNRGFRHYEISNFALPGKESRHNLKYWKCREYLGIGPAAHSFLSGKRFFYPRNIKAFINGCAPTEDGVGGECSESIMLGMRLSEGVDIDKFGYDIKEKAERFKRAELVELSGGKISLTDKGMLVSSSIITELLYEDL